MSTRRSLAGAWRRSMAAATARPVLTVAVAAVLAAALNVWWVASMRALGSFDVDETGYLSLAFQLHRSIDPAHPTAVLDVVMAQDKAPLVPAASAVALLFGPNSATTAMIVSSLGIGAMAVAVAGITKRLADGSAALVAGVVALSLPIAIMAARSYQFAPALAALLAAAVWALVSSERGERTGVMVAFGLATGLMLLSRTMAVGLLPGLAVATVVIVDTTRRALRNVAIAAFVAVAVAGPWWWRQWDSISEYLFGHGYGADASRYGPDALADRVVWRTVFVSKGVRLYLALAVIVVVVVAVGRVRRGAGASPAEPQVRRLRVAVAVVVGLGALALLSTSNLGTFFELPVLGVAVATTVAAGWSLTPRIRRPLGVTAVCVAVVTFAVSLTDDGAVAGFSSPSRSIQNVVVGGISEYQGTVVEAEPMLGDRMPERRAAAAEAWWGATDSVVSEVHRARTSTGTIVQTVCGSGALISTGTMSLFQELELHPLRDSAEDWLPTRTDSTTMHRYMSPTAGGLERVVVILDARYEPFPNETTTERCHAVAKAAGWRTFSSVSLPDGGSAEILVHPDNSS